MSLARSESLPTWSLAVNPLVSVGTMKPRIDLGSSSEPVFAQITATSAIEPLVIHILAPFRTHESPSSRAVVIGVRESLEWYARAFPSGLPAAGDAR